MKTMYFFKKLSFSISLLSLVLLVSCKDDEPKIEPNTLDATAESLTDAYFEDVDDLVLSLATEEIPGGRIATDDRIACAEISLIGTSESGNVTIDFGSGCTDPRGNVRKGKILIAYFNGPVDQIGFTTVTTFENYFINSIKLEGSRTIERVGASQEGNFKHAITLQNGKATWPDNTVATRICDFVREWNPANGTVTLEGTASGNNRRSKNYIMEITQPLVYKVECAVSQGVYMAVAGTKKFSTEGHDLIIDFGSGTCDKSVTITAGSFTRTVLIGQR